MIEQNVDEPLPEGAVMVITEDLVAKIYFADDIEAIDHAESMFSAIKMVARSKVKEQAKRKILSGFDSAASGELVNYSSSIEDQINIMSSQIAAIALSGLNPAEVLILNKDMVARRNEIIADKELRQADIDLAVTEDELNFIVNKSW